MNYTLLERLIEEDYGYSRSGNWGRSKVHSSLTVDVEDQVFYFNVRGIAGSTLDYLIQVRGMEYRSAKEFLGTQLDYKDAYVHHYSGGKEVVTYPPLVDSFHRLGKEDRSYFYERTLTDQTIDRFKLGKYHDWFTIPIYENGLLRNIQLRRDNPKSIKKYYSGNGVSLFNSDILKIVDEVYITEGPTDAIAMIQHDGVPVICSDSGGAFDGRWLLYFSRIKLIHLVFDNDEGGIKESKRLALFLGLNRCKIFTFSYTGVDKYDPIDYYKDGNRNLVDVIKKEERFSFEI